MTAEILITLYEAGTLGEAAEALGVSRETVRQAAIRAGWRRTYVPQDPHDLMRRLVEARAREAR